MSKLYGIVYRAILKSDGRCYVGQTVQTLRVRKTQHFSAARRNCNPNSYFHNAIRKYGESMFEWEILSECSSLEALNRYEKLLIVQYRSNDKEYGFNLRGGGRSGGAHSLQSRKKMSMAKLKNPVKYWQGKKRDKETKRKISIANKDRFTRNKSSLWGVPRNDNINKPYQLIPGKSHVGQSNGRAILTEEEVRKIRSLYNTGQFSYMTLALKFNVKKSVVAHIIQRHTWKHI